MTDRDFRVKNGLHVGANAFIEGGITSVNSVQFDLSAVEPVAPGQFAWNAENSTLDLGLNSTVTTQIGQEQFYLIKNQTGNTINSGNVIMAVGTLGLSGRILGALAVADGSIPSKRIIGVAAQDIPDGEDGFVSAFGKIRGLNTTAFSEGDILYADPAQPGGLANTAPQAPNNIVTVAIVITRDNNQGELFVRPTFGSSLLEDESVFIADIQDGDTIQWVSANSRFENQQAGGGGGSGLFSSVSAISSNTSASSGVLYVITDTLTLTLPSSPAQGDFVGVTNLSNTITSTVDRNSENIMNLAEDLTVDVVNGSFTLYYSGSTYGWVIV